MAERSMDEVMRGIEFLLDDLDEVCRYAVRTYRGYAPEVLVEHDARAAAACTYAHMASEAERRLIGKPNVALLDPLPLGGLKVWRVGDLAVIRFKKHDEDGQSRNYPTKQAKDYDKGLSLPGLPPPAMRLSVGYLIDATGTEYIRTQVSRPLARMIDWCTAIVPAVEYREGAQRWYNVGRQGNL